MQIARWRLLGMVVVQARAKTMFLELHRWRKKAQPTLSLYLCRVADTECTFPVSHFLHSESECTFALALFKLVVLRGAVCLGEEKRIVGGTGVQVGEGRTYKV